MTPAAASFFIAFIVLISVSFRPPGDGPGARSLVCSRILSGMEHLQYSLVMREDASKVIAVTGATSGMGKACVEELSAAGHRVYGTVFGIEMDPEWKTPAVHADTVRHHRPGGRGGLLHPDRRGSQADRCSGELRGLCPRRGRGRHHGGGGKAPVRSQPLRHASNDPRGTAHHASAGRRQDHHHQLLRRASSGHTVSGLLQHEQEGPRRSDRGASNRVQGLWSAGDEHQSGGCEDRLHRASPESGRPHSVDRPTISNPWPASMR